MSTERMPGRARFFVAGTRTISARPEPYLTWEKFQLHATDEGPTMSRTAQHPGTFAAPDDVQNDAPDDAGIGTRVNASVDTGPIKVAGDPDVRPGAEELPLQCRQVDPW